MKLLFVPNYSYISVPPFIDIVCALKKKPEIATLLFFPTQESGSYYSDENVSSLHSKGFSYKVAPVVGYDRPVTAGPMSTIRRRLKHLVTKYRNFQALERMLIEDLPDMLIVGSDLGGSEIRMLIELCEAKKIPVAIVYTCDVEFSSNKPFWLFSLFESLLSRNRLRIARFIHACTFNGKTVGSFSRHAELFVVSSKVRDKLTRLGIKHDRISIVEFPPLVTNDARTRQILGISDGIPIISIFSERIECVYGEEYACSMYQNVASILEELSNSLSFFYIVKTHPLESESMKRFIADTFHSVRSIVIESPVTAEELIRVSDVSIAHFSRVLISAVMDRKPFLSLNFMGDRNRTFIDQKYAEILEVASDQELRRKLTSILNHDVFFDALDSAIVALREEYSADGLHKLTRFIES